MCSEPTTESVSSVSTWICSFHCLGRARRGLHRVPSGRESLCKLTQVVFACPAPLSSDRHMIFLSLCHTKHPNCSPVGTITACDALAGCQVLPKLLLWPTQSQTLATQMLPHKLGLRVLCQIQEATSGQSHWLRAWTHPKHSHPGNNQDFLLQKLLSSSRKQNGHSQELPQ